MMVEEVHEPLHLLQTKDRHLRLKAPLKLSLIALHPKNWLIPQKMKLIGRKERKTMRLQEDPEM